MSAVLQFEPIEKLSSQENLYRFITMCKNDLTVFGSDLPFENNIWDISSFMEQKGKTKRIAAIFSTYEYASKNTGGKVNEEKMVAMKEPFLSFAKAYFRYRFGHNSFKSPGHLLEPLRIVDQALINIKNSSNPNDVDNFVLDEAARITKKHYSKARGYRIGAVLADIGLFLTNKRLIKIPIDWKNPIKRPPDTSRVGKEADEQRNKKMPSKLGLEALPKIFNQASTPYEQLSISLIALLICAPNRINELFLLPYDCEVTQKDSDGIEQYGLRWFPAKGAAPMIKWIIPSMVDVAKEAITRIKTVTAHAREVAQWYEDNPNRVYLSKDIENLRGKVLSTKEVAYILFGKTQADNDLERFRRVASIWINKNSVPFEKDSNKLVIQFSDLEKRILELLPDRFPYLNEEVGIKFSEALVYQRINEYHSDKGTLIPTVKAISDQLVSDALKTRGNVLSLFEKFGYTENYGSPIEMTSHQFRHWLNTLAQKGGLSQLDIAKWSGRLDIRQNQAYDHISADEMLEMAREAIGNEELMNGPLSNIDDIKKKVVISRDEFARLKVPTAHVTEYGVCIHDFTMTPCQLYRNCMGCSEHFCVKGDLIRTDRIKLRKEETEVLLERAKTAQEDGHFGANRWVESHSMDLEVLANTCEILDNDSIPDGSIIQLSNILSVSPIEQASNRRKENLKLDQKQTELEPDNYSDIKKLIDELGDF